MTEKELDKLDNKETISMLNEIDQNYKGLDLPIAEPKFNKSGELANENEVKKSLKLVLPILLVLWAKNIAISTSKSIKVMTYTNMFFNEARKALKVPKTAISIKEWNDIMDKTIKDRKTKIKIKQVINGNAKVLNKKVQDTVLKMYKDGKNYKQTAKVLQREFGYNKNKAKQIAITEKNFYKSEAQLQATQGLKVKKTWIHTSLAKEPRQSHIDANGKSVIGRDTYFNVGGNKTKAPQHFGMPSEDISCHCIMRVEIIEK